MNNRLPKVKDTMYYAKAFPTIGVFEIDELKIRTVTEKYFVGVEKRTKRSDLFSYNAIGNIIFFDRSDALKRVKEMEKDKVVVSNETYYEEY